MTGRHLGLLTGSGLALASCATVPQSCRALVTMAAPHESSPGRVATTTVRMERSSVAELRCAADQGVTMAQVELAKRYEAGAEVTQDFKGAAVLYERAAAAAPPTTAIYSPPVTLGGRGRMLFLPNSNAGPGSAEAQYRLGRMMIEGRGVPKDLNRGRALLERSAKQGYQPALAELGHGSAR